MPNALGILVNLSHAVKRDSACLQQGCDRDWREQAFRLLSRFTATATCIEGSSGTPSTDQPPTCYGCLALPPTPSWDTDWPKGGKRQNQDETTRFLESIRDSGRRDGVRHTAWHRKRRNLCRNRHAETFSTGQARRAESLSAVGGHSRKRDAREARLP